MADDETQAAEKQRTKAAAARARQDERDAEKAADEGQEPEPEEYSNERLVQESLQLVGHPSHVVAGALVHSSSRKKNHTLDEAREAVDAFLNHAPEED